MLVPRKVKFRKQHHPTRRGVAKGGTKLAFGDYGIQALEGSYLTNRQIESARIAIAGHAERASNVAQNAGAGRPGTRKPAEALTGSGKGTAESSTAIVKA